jgi:hypothetical protein
MFESVKFAVTRGVELGKTEGVMKGTKMYLNESGQIGAIGMVTALGAVLIGLYVIAIVVGSMGTQITQGNIVLSSRWNTTLSTLDTNAGSAFNIANIIPIAIVGVGVNGSMSNRGHISSLNVDSDRCLRLPVKSDCCQPYQGYDDCFGICNAIRGQHNLAQKCLG